MKITVKKNLIIFHRPVEWSELQAQLINEYGVSIIAIRDRCRRELGFTVRHHQGLVKWAGDPDYQVHLDFYNPAQQTFFVLKYLNNSVA